MDMSPTKAWLVKHRKDAGMAPFIDFAWGKRSEEELYDLITDPHQTKNLASDPTHATTLRQLREQLMSELCENADPRLANDAFDRPPYHAQERR
jgi:hypothetical protein